MHRSCSAIECTEIVTYFGGDILPLAFDKYKVQIGKPDARIADKLCQVVKERVMIIHDVCLVTGVF